MRIAQLELDIQTDSAGTGDWHIGNPPYGPMQQAASPRGYDLSDLRARQVSVDDFHSFDLILAMDSDNLANLRAIQPANGTAKLALLTDYADDAGADHVPDPYFTRDFSGALDLIEVCVEGLLKDL